MPGTERKAIQRVGTSAQGLRLRFFAAPRGQPRARRGTDVVVLVSALGLGLAIAAYPPSALERSLEAFLATLPNWVDEGAASLPTCSGWGLPSPPPARAEHETVAAVLLYRISTFYVPPAWGFPALLWLQRNRYL